MFVLNDTLNMKRRGRENIIYDFRVFKEGH